MKRSPFFILILAVACTSFAQDGARLKDFRVVFEEIQHGFETGNVGAFSSRLGTQVQVNLKNEESGSYSASHAYYILEKYLKGRKVLSFEFSAVGENEGTPFATGSVIFSHKGTREPAQVYVSLMASGKTWVIAEITVY
jgi:hypothetical protein